MKNEDTIFLDDWDIKEETHVHYLGTGDQTEWSVFARKGWKGEVKNEHILHSTIRSSNGCQNHWAYQTWEF